MEKEELDKLIGTGPGSFSPELAAQLRTRLGLPPPANMVAKVTVSELTKTNVSTNSILNVSLAERNLKEGEAYINANRDKSGVTTLPSGLQYTVINAGKGKSPTENDILYVNYRGTTLDGNEFDSSYKRGKPFQCQLNRDIIQGWSEALALMKEGAKWRVVIPARLAYGVMGHTPIGPNATLIFEMELVSIEKPTPPAEAPKGN
jgi:FKBP-type peptidyl-prolyl cis-trans isomerase